MIQIRTFDIRRDLVLFINLYRDCFAEAPWHERFTHEELVEYFTHITTLTDHIFLVAEADGQIIGGTVAFRLSDKPDVREIVGQDDDLYAAELLVRADKRGAGVAKALVERRFELARELGFKNAYVRTSVDQPVIVNLYMGRYRFQLITSQAVTSTKFIDGVEQQLPDTRLIMGGPILKISIKLTIEQPATTP